jgi:hypothetical protein
MLAHMNRIYALCHNEEVFYCGRTEQELSARLSGHKTESKTSNTSKCTFIREHDYKVTIHLLEEVEEYYNEEQMWIEDFQRLGIELMNDKLGDDTTTPQESREFNAEIQEWKSETKKKKKSPKATVSKFEGTREEFNLEVERLSKLWDNSKAMFDHEREKRNEQKNT